MPRKNPRFQSLKKLPIRQNWSRWSLYAISQLRPPHTASKTYFQQKWAAKAATRAYHGEQVREKKWKRMFMRQLPAVVGMDHTYLATYDGSEQAAGRGMGAEMKEKVRTPPMTPYMQMTYHPLERRLDTAVFRAMFASSVRQARQFVVHGLVKVNGKKMVYPGYWLNPGDMFQVEPSSVMFATGAPKTRGSTGRKTAKAEAAARAEARQANGNQASASAEEEDDVPLLASTRPEPTPAELKKHLQELMIQVEEVLVARTKRSAKDKQKFRALRQSIKRAIALWKSANPETISTLDAQIRLPQGANGRARQCCVTAADFQSRRRRPR